MRTDANAEPEVFFTPNDGKHKNDATPPGQSQNGSQNQNSSSLTWPGETGVPPPPPKRDLVSVLLHEALMVTAWTLLFPVMRYYLESAVELSSHRDEWLDQASGRELFSAQVLQSLLAGWFLKLLPSKVQTRQAPGFCMAPLWWSLLWMRRGVTTVATTTSLPHLPMRICEMVMGRMQTRELFPIALLMYALSMTLPEILAERSISPVLYSNNESGNPWLMMDLLSEFLVNTAFPVAFLVLPVMLKLNHLPPWLTLLVFYPLYNWSVDIIDGQGSTFSPTVLLTQAILHARPSCALARVVSQLAGGLAAGKIMQSYFPDDPKA
jgi:hypothetical protein